MPPQPPTGLSGVQVLPSSSDTESRAGYRPDQTMRRFFPWASTTRWIVGVSSDVIQFSGTERRSDDPSRRGCPRSEEHTSELQSLAYLVCRLLLEKKKKKLFSTI